MSRPRFLFSFGSHFGAIIALYFCCCLCPSSRASGDLVQELVEQNKLMRAQLESQQRQLDELRAQMNVVRESASSTQEESAPATEPSDRKVVLSGEVGIGFFAASNDGQYRNEEFRVDDANLHLEAQVANGTYFFGELQLSKHESLDEAFHLGEFYVEFEDVSGKLGGAERLANIRFGRVDIPFGEEYKHRDPLDNPLITHSLSDVWGTDEGVEVYGEMGRGDYAFAVLNGSTKTSRDFNADKSLALRIGFSPVPRLHFSASAMRTGELNSALEPLSEVWLGNNVFRNIGSALSTTHQGDLAEVDGRYTWAGGHLWAAIGRARYGDNDPLADNTRHFNYYQIEGMQSFGRKFYGAMRFSSLRVDKGYPLAGIGDFNKYFLGTLQTKELERWSVGGGYRFNPSLVLKADYTMENGELTTGVHRDNDMLSAQAALGF
jgi:hypothetical protein